VPAGVGPGRASGGSGGRVLRGRSRRASEPRSRSPRSWDGSGRKASRCRAVPLPGSTDCVRTVATGELPVALAEVERRRSAASRESGRGSFTPPTGERLRPLPWPTWSHREDLRRPQGARPSASLAWASAGVISPAPYGSPTAGLGPPTATVMESSSRARGRDAAMLRSRQIDATQPIRHEVRDGENAGVPLRRLRAHGTTASLPTASRLDQGRSEGPPPLRGVRAGYAKGTIFVIANQEAAIRILYEVFGKPGPTGKDEGHGHRDDTRSSRPAFQNGASKSRVEARGRELAGNSRLRIPLSWGRDQRDGGEGPRHQRADPKSTPRRGEDPCEARPGKPAR